MGTIPKTLTRQTYPFYVILLVLIRKQATVHFGLRLVPFNPCSTSQRAREKSTPPKFAPSVSKHRDLTHVGRLSSAVKGHWRRRRGHSFHARLCGVESSSPDSSAWFVVEEGREVVAGGLEPKLRTEVGGVLEE